MKLSDGRGSRYFEEKLTQSRGPRPNWVGTWRTRQLSSNGRRITRRVVLGLVSAMSEDQARELLRDTIAREYDQFRATQKLCTVPSAITPKISSRKPGMAKGEYGVIAELIVCADLTAKGYSVFRPVSPQAPCDVVYMDERGQFVRVEVKSGTRLRNGRIQAARLHRNAGKFDVLAVVTAEGSVVYKGHFEIERAAYPLDSVLLNSISDEETLENGPFQ